MTPEQIAGLPLGERGQKLKRLGLLSELLWEEQYPDQEDFPGYFRKHREWLETASVEELLEYWCRGQNISGFGPHILEAVDGIRKAVVTTRHKPVGAGTE